MSKQVKAFCKGRVPVFVERQTGKEVVYGPVTMEIIPELEAILQSFREDEKKRRRLLLMKIRNAKQEYDIEVDRLILNHFGGDHEEP